MSQFQNRVAVVTGGAQGLGAAICRRLAVEEADVVVADLKLALTEAYVPNVYVSVVVVKGRSAPPGGVLL